MTPSSSFSFELIMLRVYQDIVRTMMVHPVKTNVFTVTNKQDE